MSTKKKNDLVLPECRVSMANPTNNSVQKTIIAVVDTAQVNHTVCGFVMGTRKRGVCNGRSEYEAEGSAHSEAEKGTERINSASGGTSGNTAKDW
jgi:hypothetical protein